MYRLSIITVNLNNTVGLRKTIESVVNQTFTNFEYIIIDGGSIDGSVEVIKEFNDRISYWVSEPDKGIYNAMNKGILKSNGEYLQFLNSGDWLYTIDTLSDVFKLARTEDLLYGDIMSKYKDEKVVYESYPSEISVMRLYNSTICHQSIFHKRVLFKDNYYNELYKAVSDWEFLLKALVLKNCSYFKIEQTIVCLDKINSQEWGTTIINERNMVLKQTFSPRVIQEFEKINKVTNDLIYVELFDLIKVPIFRTFIVLIVRFMRSIKKSYRFIFGSR